MSVLLAEEHLPSTCCSTSVSIEVSGMVGVNESVRGFDERRLLFDGLARVGV